MKKAQPSTRDVVLGNSALLAAVFLFNSVAGVLTSVLLARLLSIEALGEYGYLFRVYSWLCAFGVFFLPQVLVRFVAELRGRGASPAAAQLFRWAVAFQGAVVLLVVLGSVWILPMMGSALDAALAVIMAAFAINSMSVVFENYLRGCQRFQPIASAVFLGAALRIAGLCALFLIGGGVVAALAVYTIGQLLYMAILARGVETLPRSALSSRKRSGAVLKEFRGRILRFGGTMGIAGFLSLVTWNYVEVFIIGWTWEGAAGARELAFYTLAISLCVLPNRFSKSVAGALSPAFAELQGAGRHDSIRSGYTTATVLSAAAGCWMSINLLLFAPHVYTLLFPESLLPGVVSFQLLMIPTLFLAFNYAGGTLLPTLDGHRFHLALSAVAAPVTLLVGWMLIPRWGSTGAALSNAIMQSSCVVASILFLALRRGLPFPGNRVVLCCISSVAGAAIARVAVGPPSPLPLAAGAQLALGLLLSAPIHAILLRIFFVLGKGERDMLERCTRLVPGPLRGVWRLSVSMVCAR